MKWQEIRHRIIGIQPWGVQWNPTEPERKIVRDLLLFLEDRRVLFNEFDLEVEGDVIHSLNQIRDALVSARQRLGDSAPAVGPIRQMQGACRRFLNGERPGIRVHGHFLRVHEGSPRGEGGADFFVALGELRSSFGRAIAELSARYEIDLAPQLETILPFPE